MKKCFLSIFFVHILFHSLLAQAQSDSTRLTTIVMKLERQTTLHPIEKVYLHFNKPGYMTGDTLWFKGYVTIGEHHQPSALSGILYVELIDEKDKIVKSLKLKINNGITAGEIATDPAMATGDYRVKAYTTWMRNAGPDYFFTRTFNIGNLKTNAVYVTSNIDVSGRNREGAVNAKLTYTDKYGRAYDHKQVSYEVKADSNTIYKGTGITDDKGNLMFAFSDKAAGQQKRININSHIRIIQGITVDKTVPISLKSINNENSANTDVQFFPEGGQLVAGVRSKVAFKAIGINGLSQNINGIITDNEHNEVAEFSTQHAGMGIFAITPEKGKTYTAKITLPDSTATIVALPATADKGFVLAVNNSDTASSNITVRIATNAGTISDNQTNNAFYLVGQQNGKVYYTTYGKLDNQSFTATISKSKFPTGMVQFTLFSANIEPLNERVVFIQNPAQPQLNLNLSTDKQTYKAREKVSLNFTAATGTGAANKPAEGSFSLAVYNEDSSSGNEHVEITILSGILLTSDLKGYIEEPGYYFNHPTQQTGNDLDVLMLTQGYRRFNWQNVMNETTPKYQYTPEKTLDIAGRLTTSSGKPIPGGKVNLLSTVDKLSLDTTADNEGRFSFPNIEFPDSTKLVIQAKRADDSRDVDITLNGHKAAMVTALSTAEAAQSGSEHRPDIAKNVTGLADSSQSSMFLSAQKGDIEKAKSFNFQQDNKLREVTIKERKNAGNGNAPWMAEVSRSANLNGPGHANLVLTRKDLSSCIKLTECLSSKIPGMLAKYNRATGEVTGFYFIRHMAQSVTHTPPVVFIIDGQLFSGAGALDMLNNVAADNILTVEVLESSSYLSVYGQNASGGALVITTRQGNDGLDLAFKKAPGVISYKFSGFDKSRQFYTPKYKYVAVNTIADNRTAVYWDPNIITDEKGAAIAVFYNPDVKGAYRAVVEGIDDDGNIGRYVYRYKVQ